MATTAGGVFIPGNAALIKAGGRAAAKNAKIAEDVATSGRRSASQSPGSGRNIADELGGDVPTVTKGARKVEDVTNKDARFKNLDTDLSEAKVAQNLKEAGFEFARRSEDGKAAIFKNENGRVVTIRPSSSGRRKAIPKDKDGNSVEVQLTDPN